MLKLERKVEEYVEYQLSDYKAERVRAPKIIHDTVLGSNLFMPHEVQILDLPLLQRLRRISQVAVASLVFPSGNHNRFEHTLGVTVLSEQLVNALYRKIDFDIHEMNELYNSIRNKKDYVLNHVRMAAIMHDCGHGPFSHLSEKIFKHFDDFVEMVRSKPFLSEASAHEVLSYLIITSNTFKKFYEDNIKNVYDVDLDLDFVGEMIIGHVTDPSKAFMVDMVNGPFDADKLEYIQRDSHTTGIKMVLDLHRLFYTIDLIKDGDDRTKLSVDITGVSTLEQIIFNKMMLFNTVYHHHKVRSAECLFKAIFSQILSNETLINGRKFESAADFLYLTDDDVYSLVNSDEGLLKQLALDLCQRKLPKRALTISRKTTDTNIEYVLEIAKVNDDPEQLEAFVDAISDYTSHFGKKVPKEEIWVDLQKGPTFEEAILCPIKSVGESSGYITLHAVLPVDDWVSAFSQNKWSGYIYTRPENRKVIYQSAVKVIEEAYEIKLNDFAKILSKFE